MLFNEYEKEIERLTKLKDLTDEINRIEIDKLFINQEQLAEMLCCSSRAAGEFMNTPGFPLIKIGNKPMVNIFALNEYTKQRLVLAEIKKG